MEKSKAGKLYGVTKVYVCVVARSDNYGNARLTLHGSDPWGGEDRNVAGFEMQSNRIGYSHAGWEAPSLASVRADMPDPRFDIGTDPMSKFYGAHLADDRISVEYGFAEKMARIVKIVKKIEDTIRKFNLAHVHSCQLAQWLAAFEKLGIKVELHRFARPGQRQSIEEGGEVERGPARKYLAMREASEASACVELGEDDQQMAEWNSDAA